MQYAYFQFDFISEDFFPLGKKVAAISPMVDALPLPLYYILYFKVALRSTIRKRNGICNTDLCTLRKCVLNKSKGYFCTPFAIKISAL